MLRGGRRRGPVTAHELLELLFNRPLEEKLELLSVELVEGAVRARVESDGAAFVIDVRSALVADRLLAYVKALDRRGSYADVRADRDAELTRRSAHLSDEGGTRTIDLKREPRSPADVFRNPPRFCSEQQTAARLAELSAPVLSEEKRDRLIAALRENDGED